MDMLALFPILLLLFIEVIIGVYVYRDAKRQNMNAHFWVGVSILVPLGLIIYLVARARNSYKDLR